MTLPGDAFRRGRPIIERMDEPQAASLYDWPAVEEPESEDVRERAEAALGWVEAEAQEQAAAGDGAAS